MALRLTLCHTLLLVSKAFLKSMDGLDLSGQSKSFLPLRLLTLKEPLVIQIFKLHFILKHHYTMAWL